MFTNYCFFWFSGKLQAVLLLTALVIAQSEDSLFGGKKSSVSLKNLRATQSSENRNSKAITATNRGRENRFNPKKNSKTSLFDDLETDKQAESPVFSRKRFKPKEELQSLFDQIETSTANSIRGRTTSSSKQTPSLLDTYQLQSFLNSTQARFRARRKELLKSIDRKEHNSQRDVTEEIEDPLSVASEYPQTRIQGPRAGVQEVSAFIRI